MAKSKKGEKKWIVWDSRACGDQGTDDAQVMEVCRSLEEARRYSIGMAAIYSYDVLQAKLINEEWVEDINAVESVEETESIEE